MSATLCSWSFRVAALLHGLQDRRHATPVTSFRPAASRSSKGTRSDLADNLAMTSSGSDLDRRAEMSALHVNCGPNSSPLIGATSMTLQANWGPKCESRD